MTQATCKFCALSDDTIQVICESRCLICSRCQQVPILRKLLIDHTMAIDVSSTATQPARTYLKGFCPVCESSMSTTMLTLISTYKELYKTTDDIFSVRIIVIVYSSQFAVITYCQTGAISFSGSTQCWIGNGGNHQFAFKLFKTAQVSIAVKLIIHSIS